MGITKSQIFSEEQNQLAKVAKVLGHPARIAILNHIINSNSCICNDLVDEIGLAQATISQHLKELKSIGIVSGTIEGKSICYCINNTRWVEIQQKITQFFNSFNCNGSCH